MELPPLFPLLCKEGIGEVESVAGTAQPRASWLVSSTPPALPLQRGGETLIDQPEGQLLSPTLVIGE